MKIYGSKTKDIFNNLILDYIPEDLENWTYVEPFAGSFSVSKLLPIKPKLLVYNDIHDYGIEIIADHIHHLDYTEIFKMYDSPTTLFYCDPPYYNKEHHYDCMRKDTDFHVNLHDILMEIQGRFILSSDDNTCYQKLYKGCNFHRYEGDIKTNRCEISINI